MTPPELLAACPTILPSEPESYFECPPGWLPIVSAACVEIERIAKALLDPPKVVQVKQKFSLRIYMNRYVDEIQARIDEAARACRSTCETCGAGNSVGRNSRSGWFSTKCDACWSVEVQRVGEWKESSK